MTEQPSPAGQADRDTIGSVLGRTPSGVFILTAADSAGNETGMLASWVQQASFDPPMVSVAVNNKRYLKQWLDDSPRMALSLVGESQLRLLKHFGKGFAPGEAAFDGLTVSRGQTGLLVLPDALGFLEGTVAGQVAAGDHTVYLLEITSAGKGDALATEKPMVHIRKNGFNY